MSIILRHVSLERYSIYVLSMFRLPSLFASGAAERASWRRRQVPLPRRRERIAELIHRFDEADLVLEATLAHTLTRAELGFPAPVDEAEAQDDDGPVR